MGGCWRRRRRPRHEGVVVVRGLLVEEMYLYPTERRLASSRQPLTCDGAFLRRIDGGVWVLGVPNSRDVMGALLGQQALV